MKLHREFEIPWFGLKDGMHEYRFQVTDKVIEELGFEHPDFDHLDTSVVLKMDKHNGFLQLHFDIDGHVDVACDRCGDTFTMRLWDEFDLIVKFTGESNEEEEEEEEADIVFVPRSETILDVSEWIYEFIILSMPLQHIHPDKEDGAPGCNPEALKLLNKMSSAEEAARKNLWSGLDKFKDLDAPEGKN